MASFKVFWSDEERGDWLAELMTERNLRLLVYGAEASAGVVLEPGAAIPADVASAFLFPPGTIAPPPTAAEVKPIEWDWISVELGGERGGKELICFEAQG